MSATSSTFWFWSDWLGDPAVRRLTPAARGVWIDCLSLMATACPAGYLCDSNGRKLTHEEVARVTNATADEVSKLLAEIIGKGAASVDRAGRVYNRRMVRGASIAAKKRKIAKLGGEATRLKWQELSRAAGNNAWQSARHTIPPPSLKKERKTSSFTAAARASAAAPVDNVDNASQAETKQEPPSKQASEKSKQVSEYTRADLEALYEKKRSVSGGSNGAQG